MTFMAEVEVACTEVANRIMFLPEHVHRMTLCNADIRIYPLHLNDRRCCRIYHASTMCATCVRSQINTSLVSQNLHRRLSHLALCTTSTRHRPATKGKEQPSCVCDGV
jgi:hypothetical protein